MFWKYYFKKIFNKKDKEELFIIKQLNNSTIEKVYFLPFSLSKNTLSSTFNFWPVYSFIPFISTFDHGLSPHHQTAGKTLLLLINYSSIYINTVLLNHFSIFSLWDHSKDLLDNYTKSVRWLVLVTPLPLWLGSVFMGKDVIFFFLKETNKNTRLEDISTWESTAPAWHEGSLYHWLLGWEQGLCETERVLQWMQSRPERTLDQTASTSITSPLPPECRALPSDRSCINWFLHNVWFKPTVFIMGFFWTAYATENPLREEMMMPLRCSHRAVSK